MLLFPALTAFDLAQMAELFPIKTRLSEPSFCFVATSLTSELGQN
jgi:hypothetical protein